MKMEFNPNSCLVCYSSHNKLIDVTKKIKEEELNHIINLLAGEQRTTKLICTTCIADLKTTYKEELAKSVKLASKYVCGDPSGCEETKNEKPLKITELADDALRCNNDPSGGGNRCSVVPENNEKILNCTCPKNYSSGGDSRQLPDNFSSGS